MFLLNIVHLHPFTNNLSKPSNIIPLKLITIFLVLSQILNLPLINLQIPRICI